MAKHQSDFLAKSFIRNIGKAGLLQFVQTNNHPKQQELTAILNDDGAFNTKQQTAVIDVFEAEDNPRREGDEADFKAINELCNTTGHNALMRECERRGLEEAIRKHETAQALAMYIYLNHRQVFDNALLTAEIDKTHGWKLFVGSATSTVKPWPECKEAMITAAKASIRKITRGGAHLVVDEYYSDTRIILDIRAEGQMKMVDSFTEAGELEAEPIRPPIMYALVYYPNSGALKVKTPHTEEALAKALHQDFANSMLTSPDSLLNVKTERVVNLEEARQNKVLTPPTTLSDIKSAKVTGIKFLLGNRSLYVHDPDNIYGAINEYRIPLRYANILRLKIQFEYLLNDKTKTTTVELVQQTNRVTTNTSDIGNMIEECLKYWGYISV